MENGNGKLLWLIAVVNVLTFILLIAFIIASWDVITMKETSREEIEQQTPTSTPQQTPQPTGTPSGQQTQPTKTPSGQQIDIIKCMQDCMKGGKQPSECESQCGATGKPSPTGETVKGKCGDGTCDSIEKEKGVCPEDCK